MLHNLRIAIEEKFGTQLACAKAAEIHPIRLNRICRGWVEPTQVEQDRLAAIIGVDSAWLFSKISRIPTPRSIDLSTPNAMMAAAHDS